MIMTRSEDEVLSAVLIALYMHPDTTVDEIINLTGHRTEDVLSRFLLLKERQLICNGDPTKSTKSRQCFHLTPLGMQLLKRV